MSTQYVIRVNVPTTSKLGFVICETFFFASEDERASFKEHAVRAGYDVGGEYEQQTITVERAMAQCYAMKLHLT